MIVREEDLDWDKIEPEKFEELCYDLFLEYDYFNLNWLKGSFDFGRDLVAYKIKNDNLVGPITEKWHFECKKYSGGIGKDLLSTKLSSAEANRADHLVLITNSYFTPSAKEELDKLMNMMHFKLHYIEGKKLINMLIQNPKIVFKYFDLNYRSLLNEFKINCNRYGFLPNITQISKMINNIQHKYMTVQDYVFLLLSITCQSSDNQFLRKGGNVKELLNKIFNKLNLYENKIVDESILIKDVESLGIGKVFDDDEDDDTNLWYGELTVEYMNNIYKALYSLIEVEGNCYEVLLILDKEITFSFKKGDKSFGRKRESDFIDKLTDMKTGKRIQNVLFNL
ncbi:restriction endonuclease [Clostridium estertheticum]|uniref:restriction endonuclease n=1 Tax=Clostridium estertheticum TaxID=238834 RepID=UPI001C0B3DE7|nr:restriction endonuclease [Clostridium estertheticum]MBU3185639.1 restriction endonuclease [Clostridium estertheticum]